MVEKNDMQNAYLVALQQSFQSDWEVEDSLAELADLARDAGLNVVETVVQKRSYPDPGTFIGTGKALEIGEMLDEDSIVIFDDELTPAQQGNLSDLMDAPVIDRTQLILDIFAQRARSNEGKIQVELAQLNYLLPRLTGKGRALSRLGGGIGTRGPGETKLETDRRRIRRRISDLRKELEKIRQTRSLQREGRVSRSVPVVALVGYTNAGKSTLLRALTGSEVFVADQLFATLDPTIRRWDLTEGRWVYLTDTVGFIRKLPHTLVAAFQATLEEVVYADLLLHVIDASHPQALEQQEAVEEVLKEIGAAQPVIAVYNKVDLVDHPLEVREPDQAVSAVTGQNLDRLTNAVYQFFAREYAIHEYFFPFSELKQASILREQATVLGEEFTEEGVLIRAEVDARLRMLLQPFQK
ncbi:MAG: GTPase HflX [Limnochordia bacterium]|jgi:GTP-binding protein HflX|nr:GTPase HflX [Bacillota bacterium]NLL08662.1 GTPase HflX [Bacillota bacterium]HBG08920.1 GTPase HflX [Bacillota bacterium]